MLNVCRQTDERLHVALGRQNRAVAAQIHAHARKAQVLELMLDLERGIKRILLVPKAFAQVAKIHHQDDLVNLALLFGLFVQRTQHDNITLQADVTQLHHVGELGEHRDTNEHQRLFADTRLADRAHLADAGRGNELHAALFINAHDLRQRRHSLDDARDLDERIMAALYERCQICCQFIEIEFHTGILIPIHCHDF